MRIQIRLYFTKANLLINYHRVFFPSSPFFRRIATIFKQQTHKKVLFRQLRAYLLINSFEKYQYVLLCDTNTSDFLHFSQTAFFYDLSQQIKRHRCLTNASGVFFCSLSFHPSRCSTISRLSRPTWQSRNSTLTPAAFASASAVPNSGCVLTFGRTSVMPSI